MKVAFQMEHMSETVKGDNHSLLIIQEACKRGFDVYHYHPDTVTMSNDGVFAKIAPLNVDLTQDEYFKLGEYSKQDLSTMDVIWFRQNPPFDMCYVTNTFMLDFLKDKGVLVSNNPFWIRNMPDKLSIFDYPDYLPPSLVTRDLDEVSNFLDIHKDIVIKPLYSFHGHGVVRTSVLSEAEVELSKYPEPLLFQPFLPQISEGNRRIVLFDGEIVGALKTINKDENEFRIYRDSVDVACTPTKKELELCQKLSGLFKERGLHFIGVDFIGPYLMEINTGSIGSLLRLNEIYGECFEAKLWDVIEHKQKFV